MKMLKPDEKRIAKGMWWDRAWSLVEGCAPVSAGCKNCWAASQSYIRKHQKNEAVRRRHEGLTAPDRKFNGKTSIQTQDLFKPGMVGKPTVWTIWNDLFHESVNLRGPFIRDVFRVMAANDHHLFLVLTKRPERMKTFVDEVYEDCLPDLFPHIWLGTTVESQLHDDRILILKDIPAAVRFLSMGPLLGPFNFLPPMLRWIGLVIAGGESGPGARPMQLPWIRTIRDECAQANVPFFFKQWGEYCPPSQMPGDTYQRVDAAHNLSSYNDYPWPVGKKAAGRLLDGEEHNGWPS